MGGTQECFRFWDEIQGWGSGFIIDGGANIFKFLFQVALCRFWGKG